MIKIKEIIKTFSNNYLIFLYLYLVIISIVNAIYVYIPQPDEWLYLHETIVMSELLKNGQWIGDQMIGTHGFIFKMIPSLIFIFMEPTIYMPYFFHILLNILIIYFTYKSAQKLLNSDKWAALATFFLINVPLFYQGSILNAYLRETPALLTISLLLYLILYKRNIFWISFALLLSLDAKEYVGVVVVTSYFIHLVFETFYDYKPNYYKMIYMYIYKLFVVILPIGLWLYLMFYTPFIPENQYLSYLLKLNIGAETSNPIFDIRASLYNVEGENARKAASLKKIESKEKWLSSKDRMFEIFHSIKYQNEFKQTVDYTKLNYYNFDSLEDFSEKNINHKKQIIETENNQLYNNKKKIAITNLKVNEEVIERGKSKNPKVVNKVNLTKPIQKAKKNFKIDSVKQKRKLKINDSLNILLGENSDSTRFNDLDSSNNVYNDSTLIKTDPTLIKKSQEIVKLKKIPLESKPTVEPIISEPGKKGVHDLITKSDSATSDIKREEIFTSPISKMIIYSSVVFQRVFSHYTFNYGSFPIFIIVSVLLGMLLIIYRNHNRSDWTFIIIFLFFMLAVYLLRAHLTRYFHPAVLSISLIFLFTLKEYYKKRWFLILMLMISLPLSIYQISVNNFTPMFIASLTSQILIIPIFWIKEKYKEKYIISFLFFLIFLNASYIVNGNYVDLSRNPKGNFEKEVKLISSYFKLNTDTLIYLTHPLYPGRTTGETIKFYNRSLLTLGDGVSLTHLLNNKVPKFYFNNYYHQNLFSLFNFYQYVDFSNWNRIKMGYLPKYKINRVVFLIENNYNWNELKPSYNQNNKDIFQIYDYNNKSVNQDHWGVAETYKNLLFKYRPEWLELIEKNPIGDNKTMYLFRINDNKSEVN